MLKIKIFTILGSVLVSGLLYAQNIQVTDKWQLIGALEDINSSSFDGKCVNFVWKYDNGWQVYIANGNSYNLSNNIIKFNTINKGQGFWIKGNGSCDINTTNVMDLKSLIVGKTYYIAVNDVMPHHVETIQFKNDEHTMLNTCPDNGQWTTSSFNYSITGNNLRITGTGGDGDQIDVTIQGPFTQTESYIQDVNGGKIYKTKQAAENALIRDTGNSSSGNSESQVTVTGGYTQNGNTMTITRAEANMNHGNPPIFQFNLKHDLGGEHSKDMVQINTTYTSKQDFDNAFSDNSLVLSFSNHNLQGVGMEIAGKGWVGNESVSNNFQVTVTKNNDGTYNVVSQGSFVADGNNITSFYCDIISYDSH